MTAIKILKIAIDSHQVWIDFIKEHSNYEGETHGDSKFHQDRIDDYNAAITDIEAKNELIFAYDAVRSPVINKTIIDLRKSIKTAKQIMSDVQVRIAFIGHPNEPIDWSGIIGQLEDFRFDRK